MSTKVSALTQATNLEMDAASLAYVVTDPSGTPASKKSALGRLGLPTGWVDEVVATTGTQTLTAGTVTHGTVFLRLRDGQQGTGVRFWWAGGVGAQTVDVSLYEYAGNIASAATQVATASVSCNAAGIYSGTFATPYTLVIGKLYSAAWYNATYWSDYTSLPYLGRRDQVRFRDYYLIDGGVYKSGGGAAAPNTTLGVGTDRIYMVEPLISG